MSIRFIPGALLLALLTTLTAGCGGGGSTNAEPDPTVEPSAGTPSMEATGHESPVPGGKGRPYIDVAAGPAGDGGSTENDDGSLCMDVRWLGDRDGADLGEGIAFVVTEVRLAGARRANVSCPDDPCPRFTFDSNTDNCSYPVRPGRAKGTLSLYGQVRCSAPPQDCQEFRSHLKRRTVPIPPAQTGGEEPEEPTQTEEPTEPASPTPDEQPPPTE